MLDIRPVLQIIGVVLCLLALSMAAPALIDLIDGDSEWQVFAASAGFTLFAGLAMKLGADSPFDELSIRQFYLTGALGWVLPCLFAALPFAFGPADMSPADAIFEAVSGLTTTGATVLSGLDDLPRGLLLWRGLLHWMGGLGFVAVSLTLLPRLAVGGMQLFRLEMPSLQDRGRRRVTRVATSIVAIYVGLTVIVALALWGAGMSRFDAAIHAMSTVSTGGFSTHDSSLAFFHNPLIEIIVMVGMALSGLPFLLYFMIGQGQWRSVIRDQQLRWYFGVMLGTAVVLALWLMIEERITPLAALRYGTFTVISVMTGTGMHTIDFSQWSGLAAAAVLFLAFVGGCAGSTAGGIKVFRLHLLFANARGQMRQLLRPHGVHIPAYNKHEVSEEVLESVMGFLFVFLFSFAVLAMALGMLGLDFLSAISGSVAAIANMGVGLGNVIGPGSTFAGLPDTAKILLAIGMLFGRLEMFVFLVLCVPSFWKQ